MPPNLPPRDGWGNAQVDWEVTLEMVDAEVTVPSWVLGFGGRLGGGSSGGRFGGCAEVP